VEVDTCAVDTMPLFGIVFRGISKQFELLDINISHYRSHPKEWLSSLEKEF